MVIMPSLLFVILLFIIPGGKGLSAGFVQKESARETYFPITPLPVKKSDL
jgi:hypothetical protein